ncbi:DUF2807 domain-containing protein [Brevundimonas sp.]|uniref:GIN domain-containing protein n=1 Tax=Brevundimonas sp. TaxID=1871086 RepID=UPI0025F0B844|nr:DUF2807 domain-containing protein [Brevundimonas sp.]
MVRTLLIIAGAGFVLMLACFAGAAALGGPDLMRNGWNWTVLSDGHGGERLEPTGPDVTRQMEWTGGDHLVVAIPADVTFVQGDAVAVEISGPQNSVDRITLVDGRLDFEPGYSPRGHMGFVGRSPRIQVRITAPDVSRFAIEGSGDLDLQALDLDALEISVRGSGDVTAAGRGDQLTLGIRGSGEAYLNDLSVRAATVEISGSGEAELSPTESADITINGSGDVDLLQRPADLNTRINGSGDITVMGEEAS